MPVFLCRWPNGDVSLVLAEDADEAAILLDELGNADEAEFRELENLLIDFRLEDDGSLTLQQWGTETRDEILGAAYPLLAEALDDHVRPDAEPPWDPERVREAVEDERSRLRGGRPGGEPPQARTEAGRRLQESLGAPAALIDRLSEIAGTEVLKRNRLKGPKH